MSATKTLLEQRNEMKKKKPEFIRQDWQKALRIKKHWRHPEGMHSKMRKKLKSNRRQPSIGFSSPKSVRYLTHEGYRMILVHNVKEISTINEPITIAGDVGLKKKLEIAKKAKEKKLKILNIKDIDKFIAEAEQAVKQRKEEKTSKLTKKEKLREERLKKAAEKEKKEDEKKEETTEEKAKRENEEKRKVLEKGQ